MRFKLKILIAAFCALAGTAQAATQQSTKANLMLVPAQKVIANLQQVINDTKAKARIPVLFPAQVPVDQINQKYYASATVGAEGNNYVISIGKTADCNGQKYCNVANISGALGERPQIYSAMRGPDLTEPMELTNDNRGYFTPAHAEGDFWPTMIEWRMDNILYRIAWTLDSKNEMQMIVALANSAVQAGKR